MKNSPVKYLITLLIVAIATGLHYLLWPVLGDARFALFYPAILLAALYGDGLSAILLSAIVVQYIFVPPRFSFHINWPIDVARLTIFILSGLMIRQITVMLSRALAKVRQTELRLSTTLSSIGDAVISTDAEGRVVFLNPVAEKITQWSLSEAKGKPLTEIFNIVNEKTGLSIANPVLQVLKNGIVEGLANHTVIIGKYGQRLPIEDSAAPIRLPGGKSIEGVVLVFRDVSDSHEQVQRAEKAFHALQDSEAKLRSVLDNALDAVVGMNDIGLVNDWNLQAEAVFGYSREEALGARMSGLIIPQHYRDAHEKGMRHYLATGIGPVLNKRIEITALHKSGREFPIELSITPIQINGKVSFAAFIRDISEQKRAAKDLVLKSDAIENSLNAFDIVSSEGKFVYANRAYLRMWGYASLDEILGQSPADHCADPSTPGKIISALKEKGECTIEFLAKRKDGSTFDVIMWARRAFDPDGNEVYPTTAIDISERKRAEKALQEAIRTRDEFIGICSHELKTPITSMKLQFQMAEMQLRKQDPRVFKPEFVKRRIVNSNRQLDRMTRLIDEMLDVSRIDSGRLLMDLADHDLSELLNEIADRFSEQFSLSGSRLVAEIPPGVHLKFDRYRIEQVITNLFTNAIKYGAGKSVHLRMTRQKDSVQISVSDEGAGIGADNLERIFQKFERAVSSTNISGLGLGLFISRQIVEGHHGKIWAESKPGKGSTFFVELPISPEVA